jgi:CHAT domain-containing protein
MPAAAAGPALIVGFGGARPEARLSALPRVADEVRELERLYGSAATALLGPDATAAAITAKAATHAVVHIAGHAVADNMQPWESRIFLAPAAGRDALTVADIGQLRLHPGSLVLLSACSTAAGSIFRGEGVINLARPFLAAGASAVLASLWPVRDDDAARMMVSVHRELIGGAGLSAALTTAQRAELQAHPDRWQPWMVLGTVGPGTR